MHVGVFAFVVGAEESLKAFAPRAFILAATVVCTVHTHSEICHCWLVVQFALSQNLLVLTLTVKLTILIS